MKKYVYTITEVCVGTGYSDEPQTLYVFSDLGKALPVFEEIIMNSQPSESVEFEESKYINRDGSIIYELTNFDEDYHLVIKLEKVELN